MRLAFLAIVLGLSAQTARATDGSLDATFGDYRAGVSKVAFDLGSTEEDRAVSVLLASDGKLVLVGTVDTAAGPSSAIAAARLSANGVLDTSFGIAGRFSYAPAGGNPASAWAGALQSDGKIVIVGEIRSSVGTNVDFLVCRLTAAGALDAGFGSAGCTVIPFDLGTNYDSGRAVAVQRDGKIVVGGVVGGPLSGFRFGFARLTAAGALDPTFGAGGSGKQVITRFADLSGGSTADYLYTLVIQTDGRIIGAGTTATVSGSLSTFGFARLDAAGMLDTGYGNGGVQTVSFPFGGAFQSVISSAALQRDGRLVVAGYTPGGLLNVDFAFARLLVDGSLDTSFNGSGTRTVGFDLGAPTGSDMAQALAIQSDGRIVAAGYSHNSAGGGIHGDDISICRLNADGSLDTAFGTAGKATFGFDLGGGNFDRAVSMTLQGGRIVLAGEVALDPGNNRDFIALRLDNNLIFTDSFD